MSIEDKHDERDLGARLRSASVNAATEGTPNAGTTANTAPSADGVVVLNLAFRPVAFDRGAEAIFGSLNGRPNGRGDEVPEPILSRLHSHSSQDGDGSPMYLSAGGCQYSCRIFVVRPCDSGEPMFTLYFRRQMSVIEAVHQIAAEYRLTDREEEALLGLFMGLTGKEVAAKMKISPNTVKAFVRLAMVKVGTSSRAHLFAKLLDRQSG